MVILRPHRREAARSTRIRATHPTLEGLEGRVLLYSTTGGMWSGPARVTYSIVPDGTSIGGIPSSLQQTLSTQASWVQQIQTAAAVWEKVAGINLVRVPDNGAPIGSSGNQQGDPNFGDIRIGGMAQSGSQLAFAYAPPPFNGGSNAGDIFFNTAQLWQTNATTYDLLTVAVHEFGHALGMGHSSSSYSDMYSYYINAKQSLNSDDTLGIQSIYGTRQPDASNNSSSGATDLTPYINNGQASLPNLDISSNNDLDWYQVTTSAAGNMVVTMQSSNLSSLLPRITVYDGNKQNPTDVIGSNYGDTVSVTRAVSPGTWYIRAMAGTGGPAGAGAYGLQVNFGSGPQAPIAPPDTAVAAQPDQGPTTYPMGTGWMIGGQFVPFLGDLPAQLIGGLVDGLHRITVGTLSGYGDVMEVGAPAGHGHRHGGGAGDMQHGGPHRDRDAPPPGVPSGATIIDPAANLGADDSRGAIATGPQRRSEAPRRAEAARPGAVDVALAGWGPDSLPGGRARFVRWRPAESGPIRPLSLGHDGDRRMIAHARPPKPSAMVPP